MASGRLTHQEKHHASENTRELAGLLHGVGDRDDLATDMSARTMIYHNSSGRTKPIPSNEKTAVLNASVSLEVQNFNYEIAPYQKWPVLGVEEFDLGVAVAGHDGGLASKDVDKSRENEGVGYQSGRAKLGQVPYKCEREEYNHLKKDEVLDAEKLRTVGNG